MYSVYILYSEKLGKYYIGSSIDVHKRLSQHNSSDNVHWTKTGLPWILKAEIALESLNLARKMEYFIKSKKKKSFIELVIQKQKDEEFLSWMKSSISE